MLFITDHISIPLSEITFTASRSSGPGGQHVNTSDTRVTLLFDVDASESLTPFQKTRLKAHLAGRVDKRGVLRVTSQDSRSQKMNKEAAISRFITLLQEAFKRVKPRKKTRVPRSAKRKRLDAKKRTSQRKQQRQKPDASRD